VTAQTWEDLDGRRLSDDDARLVASWWQQAAHGHAGTFARCAAGEDVANSELTAAIESELDHAEGDQRDQLEALRDWATK
jgi:hypothetical protein